jgi:hypothetical protein
MVHSTPPHNSRADRSLDKTFLLAPEAPDRKQLLKYETKNNLMRDMGNLVVWKGSVRLCSAQAFAAVTILLHHASQ